LERLVANAKVAWVQSQHPPTQWNLKDGNEAVLNKEKNPSLKVDGNEK
jgi:hypothetical protein